MRAVTAWIVAGVVAAAGLSEACSLDRLTDAQRFEQADAVCVGTVVAQRCSRNPSDGGLYTDTLVDVREWRKGETPGDLTLRHRGGFLDGVGEVDGETPSLEVGREYHFYLGRRADGSVYCLQGLALPVAGKSRTPAYVFTTNNLLRAQDGVASRFVAPDAGEPIPYLVDMDTLPAGISPSVAMQAVSNALQAWEQVASVRFRFEGVTSFGRSAAAVTNADFRLRLQLHDSYGYITSGGTLGKGGQTYRVQTGTFPNGGLGGRVAAFEFDRTVMAYVVLKHTAPAMCNAKTFEEILCHELGHVLSLAHSSDDPGEDDVELTDALMYYSAHLDGRGASLKPWDNETIRVVYPTNNTPPYGYDRMVDVITSDPMPSGVLGLNSWPVGYDQQGGPTTLTMVTQTSINGQFSILSSVLRYTPDDVYSDSLRLNPAGNQSWDRCVVRVGDGVNLSAPVTFRVLSFSLDDDPADGLPDTWAATHWPGGGSGGGGHDFDKDGLSNIEEWMNASNPKSFSNGLWITDFSGGSLRWQGKPYDWYEVLSATNLGLPFVRLGNPRMATNATTTVPLSPLGQGSRFFRMRKVP